MSRDKGQTETNQTGQDIKNPVEFCISEQINLVAMEILE